MAGRSRIYISMSVAILAVSFAATFIRLAGMPPVLIAALRMLIAAAFLAPAALLSAGTRREIMSLGRGEIALLCTAGLLLAAHFFFWITSLSLTDVPSSVVLVATNPIFVALYGAVALRERMGRPFWIGLGLAVAGAAVIGRESLLSGGTEWRGNMLALAGSVAVAGYFIVGGALRRRLSLVAYVFPVYATAGVALAVLAAAMRVRWTGHGTGAYLHVLALAVVCQIIGHSLFNWSLRHLPASVVTLGVLGEPVGASIIALIVLGEEPTIAELVGGGAILAGIAVVLRRSGHRGKGTVGGT